MSHPSAPAAKVPPVVRILYADDNVDHLDLFRAALRRFPFPVQVLHATTGAEASEMLTSEDAMDLVVLDYRLPDTSGIELLRELAGPGRPPVIIITGEGDEKTAVTAMKLGAYDYVVKDDLIGDELPKAITSALERHGEARKRDEERARLAELAFTDALTGLRNRRFFDESFEREHASAQRYGRSLALLVIDFDHFKRVNDELGHAVGDRVLAESARVMTDLVRASDLLARYGGEELVALLPDTDLGGGKILGERMRRAVSELAIPVEGAGSVSVTISVGLAALGPETGTPTALLAAADAALYRAKREGRNRLVVADGKVAV